MPKASRESASDSVERADFTGRYEDLEGGYTVGFETFIEKVDLTPRLRGLPDDRCQSPHWGYVLRGRLTYGFADRDETIHGGEAFYVPPGHTLVSEAGTEVVFFSPTTVWHDTLEKIGKPEVARV